MKCDLTAVLGKSKRQAAILIHGTNAESKINDFVRESRAVDPVRSEVEGNGVGCG